MTVPSIGEQRVSPAQTARPRALRVALWGGTGAAGGEVLRQSLAEPRIGEIVAFTRRPLSLPEGSERVKQVQIADFLDMTPYRSALRNFDVVYWCLGISQLHEPTREGYRRVTRDITLAAATLLKDESPNASFHYLSGLGAARNGMSPVMWGRVKGEAEQALIELEPKRLHIYRPTFIHSAAKRERPTRGDQMAEALYFRYVPLLTVSTVDIAHAMLHLSFNEGDRTHGPWGIGRIARAYRQSLTQVV